MKTFERVDQLVMDIKQQSLRKGCFIIALTGFGGSGKSTLARELAKQLNDTHVLCVDDFIVNRLEGRFRDWSSFDWERLKREVLMPIRSGKTEVTYHWYNWETNTTTETKRLTVPRVLIL